MISYQDHSLPFTFIANENDIITKLKSLATKMREQVDTNGNFGAKITLNTYDFVFTACIQREPHNFSLFIYEHGIMQFTISLLSSDFIISKFVNCIF